MVSRLGIMSNIEKDDLVRLWDRVLSDQTILFGPEELSVLQQWGFGSTKKDVLDAGCGNGAYGSFLADHFTGIQFFGIDSNEKFIQEFRRKSKRKSSNNYTIYKCDINADTFPKEIVGKFDQCLLRLVLQHVAKPASLLKCLFKELPSGGQVYVVEEDDGFFNIYPDCRAFYDVVKIWKRICDHAGSVRYIGREIPKLLTESGFIVKRSKVLLHSNFEVGSKLMEYLVTTVKMLQRTNPNLIAKNEPERIAKEFDSYLDKHRDGWFAVYPQVLTMGVKI